MAHYQLVVVGSGIAGLSAALHARRLGLETANLEMMMPGGLVANINHMNPRPAEASECGFDYASDLMAQAAELGVTSLGETVGEIGRDATGLWIASDGGRHTAAAIILASGARLRRLGIPGELEFEHRGVAQCADCDGPMYVEQEVVVVGGGDSALQEALSLAKYCSKVHLVHRGSQFSAQRVFVDAVAVAPNIHPRFGCAVQEIQGVDGVESVRLRTVSDGSESSLRCKGVFAFVGLDPVLEFAPTSIDRDANGFARTDSAMRTSMPGVFAVGAVRAGFGGLLTDAITDAQTAAKAVHEALNTRLESTFT